MSDRSRHRLVLLVVLGLIAASVLVIATRPTILGLDVRGGVQLVYQGQPSAQSNVTPSALTRAVNIMRARVDQLGVSQAEIQTDGSSQISVGLPDVSNINRAEQAVGTTAMLYFYDWEADALTPSGSTVASQLLTQDHNAVAISQGSGLPGGGSMGLYAAVTLASRQSPATYPIMSRKGAQYYLFGRPGSAACAVAATDAHHSALQGRHCLLSRSGIPDNEPPGTTLATATRHLYQDLPAGITPSQAASEGQVLAVAQGTVVLQAAAPSANTHLKLTSPNAQFYVLRDNVALTGNDITNPTEGTDAAGRPDVQFGFTSRGAARFQSVTGHIARRAAQVSLDGRTLEQHFAVALGGIYGQLLTVPQINSSLYPDGIPESAGNTGAEITGAFTATSASDLANQLRFGALPINLKPISENRVSATLGSQALHRAVVAGAVGLLVVLVFLIAYYRVLGLIAVAGLAAYALYFYALIKLIPITLTLPGIAGLILTIGVAADANIVIFERVKEEIRAGRTTRAAISTGYKKGLTAIIDANVVTIMTAFILFALATAEVQGFAFTLGIGVIVSLFTAVIATQAILSTAADTRTIASPSALGAARSRREWRFDFMGASRYFFCLSGVILVIGALAIGGRGLNLGIDFTSGTRITTTLINPATAREVQAAVAAAGASGPTVQKVGNTGNTFQISSRPVKNGTGAIETALQNRFGIKTNPANNPDFDSTTVGPTFGRTVANSAVIAIIASLLAISLYVTLRFDWKFAIPVLIALMHDLLITAGVYALTGRVVTVDTVAALLTILGYSLYDTIIVFDRVRENIPRMPRAAFSQIVNRSMSEVLTRSLATTSCTLLPIIALLLLGGSTLQDFAFALLIGVASGAYSSIFIASPVLTHWKERESLYRHRRARIETDLGAVPAYAAAGSDIEAGKRHARPRRAGLSDMEEVVSAAEFEQMKRDLDIGSERPRRTAALTRRLAQATESQAAPRGGPRRSRPHPGSPATSSTPGSAPPEPADEQLGAVAEQPPSPVAEPPREAHASEEIAERRTDAPKPVNDANAANTEDFQHAPDEAENEGIAPQPSRPPKPRRRRHHRRHR